MALGPRARILLVAASTLLGLTALVWYLSSRPRSTPVTPISVPPTTSQTPLPANDANSNGGASVAAPSAAAPGATGSTPSPNASPDAGSASSPTGTPPPPSPAANDGSAPQTSPTTLPPAVSSEAPANGPADAHLLLPVAGVRPEQLQDTYTQSRSAGRTHNAIDIMAACGTPVVAATDGTVIKLSQSERGGITVYQLGTDNRTVYYYAHLARYADGLAEQRFARRGELLGYVGDTGNSGKDNCHLHFSIWLVTDPKRFWDGENVNPYPLLKGKG